MGVTTAFQSGIDQFMKEAQLPDEYCEGFRALVKDSIEVAENHSGILTDTRNIWRIEALRDVLEHIAFIAVDTTIGSGEPAACRCI